MGCCCSSCHEGGSCWRRYMRVVKGINVVKGIDPSFYEPYLDTFSFLGLSQKHTIRLLNIFFLVDTDMGGSISTLELLMFLDLERTEFSEAVFAIFDYDQSDEIDFKEWVLAMWNYCSLTDREVLSFAFHVFAHDNRMKIKDCDLLLSAVFGKPSGGQEQAAFTRCKNAIYEAAGGIYDYGLDEATWVEFSKRHASVVFPCFELQRRLREHVLGKSFWRSRVKDRKKRFAGKSWNEIDHLLTKYIETIDRAKAVKPKVVEDVAAIEKKLAKKFAALEAAPPKKKIKKTTTGGNKKTKFRTIMLHGFEQVVPVEVAEEMVRRGELDPAPPEVALPTSDFDTGSTGGGGGAEPPAPVVKRKPISVKRSRQESIDAIRELHQLKRDRVHGGGGGGASQVSGGAHGGGRRASAANANNDDDVSVVTFADDAPPPAAANTRAFARPRTAGGGGGGGGAAASSFRAPASGGGDSRRPYTAPSPASTHKIPGLEKLHKGSGVRMGALSRAADRPHRLANSDAEKAATALAFAQEHPWLFGPTPTEATDVFDDGYGFHMPPTDNDERGSAGYVLGGTLLTYTYEKQTPSRVTFEGDGAGGAGDGAGGDGDGDGAGDEGDEGGDAPAVDDDDDDETGTQLVLMNLDDEPPADGEGGGALALAEGGDGGDGERARRDDGDEGEGGGGIDVQAEEGALATRDEIDESGDGGGGGAGGGAKKSRFGRLSKPKNPTGGDVTAKPPRPAPARSWSWRKKPAADAAGGGGDADGTGDGQPPASEEGAAEDGDSAGAALLEQEERGS